MSSTIWIIIGIIFVVVWVAIAIEIYTSPIRPDDYDTREYKKEDIDSK